VLASMTTVLSFQQALRLLLPLVRQQRENRVGAVDQSFSSARSLRFPS
jgi:hypothetical protein